MCLTFTEYLWKIYFLNQIISCTKKQNGKTSKTFVFNVKMCFPILFLQYIAVQCRRVFLSGQAILYCYSWTLQLLKTQTGGFFKILQLQNFENRRRVSRARTPLLFSRPRWLMTAHMFSHKLDPCLSDCQLPRQLTIANSWNLSCNGQHLVRW